MSLSNGLSVPRLEKIQANNLEMITSNGKTKCKIDTMEETFRCIMSSGCEILGISQ